MIVEKTVNLQSQYIKVNYLGYVNVKFDNNNPIYLPSNYSEVNEAILKIPKFNKKDSS